MKVREDLFKPTDFSAKKSVRKIVKTNKGLFGVEREFNACEIILHNTFYTDSDRFMDIFCIKSLILKGAREDVVKGSEGNKPKGKQPYPS